MKVFFFTATGNCLDIAKRIGGELISIPQALKENNLVHEDDKIGIVYPCFYAGTPVVVQEFLKKATLKSPYVFAIMTYGNFSGGGVDHIRKCAESNSITLSYVNELLMIDNYIPMFDMDAQVEKEPEKNIDASADRIIKDIHSSVNYICRKNALRRFFSGTAQSMYLKHHGTKDKKYTVDENCTACGICRRVCPGANITGDKKPQFNNRCYECLACTHLCPTNAIRVKGERSRSRFKNRNVTVKEIIAANNRN